MSDSLISPVSHPLSSMHAWHETKMRLTRLDVENPQLILIVGSVGLALNMLVLSFLHGERTTPRPHLERNA